MSVRALLQISPDSWKNRSSTFFHQLLLLKIMMITILMGIGIPIYATVFVRAQLAHTFVLQVLIATVCFVAYFYVRRIEQVYKASIFIITLLSFLLISIMISSALGDNSGAYHHVATIILATSFLLGQRFALLCYLLFLILYLSICSGYWHYFFPNTILPLHPARTSIFIDRILEINCVYSLAFLYDRLKISQQARIKEQEREVAKQEKQLSINRMAGGIAHEINNPLAILLGYLEILERHEFSKKDLERIGPKIQMAAKRIQFVVWSLNQVNSGDNRKHGSALLETVLEHVKVRVHDLNPSLFLHMASGHGIKVLLPAEDLQNILYTILENAVEALAQKTDGQVHVKVTAAEDSVEIEVWDNGDEPIIEDLQKFTEPFYTTKLDKPGRGMGLALSAAIIRAIDGQLVYRRDGAWTVATMTVPGHDTKGL